MKIDSLSMENSLPCMNQLNRTRAEPPSVLNADTEVANLVDVVKHEALMLVVTYSVSWLTIVGALAPLWPSYPPCKHARNSSANTDTCGAYIMVVWLPGTS